MEAFQQKSSFGVMCSQDHSHVQRFPIVSSWTQHLVILQQHSKDTQLDDKGKDYRESREESTCFLVLSHRRTRIHSLPNKDGAVIYVQCFCTGKPTRDSAAKIFIGDDHVDTLCLACTKFQAPKRISSLGIVNHLYDFRNGSSSKFPDFSQWPLL